MTFVPDNLDSLKYAELQQLAKQCGVKANMKVSDGVGKMRNCERLNAECQSRRS